MPVGCTPALSGSCHSRKGHAHSSGPFPSRRQGRCLGSLGARGEWREVGGRWRRGARSAVPVRGRRVPGAGRALAAREGARRGRLRSGRRRRLGLAGRGCGARPVGSGVEGLGPGFERSARGASDTGRGAGWASQPRSEPRARAGRSTTPFCGLGLPLAASGPRLRRRCCLTCEPRRGGKACWEVSGHRGH